MRFHPANLLLAAALTTAPLLAQSPSPSPAAMPPTAEPSFEVATIRPAKPGTTTQGIHPEGDRIFMENESLSGLICVAYNLQKTQLIGAPSWLDDRYDIEGSPDTPGKPTFRQVKIMLQKLLADRFSLKFHHEQRDLSIYALVLAKGGPKLTPNTTGPEGQPDESSNSDGAERYMKFSNSTIADLTLEMEFYVGKPIVNETGLTGRYNFTLNWARDDVPQQDSNALPGLFTAIQEQLGLKLEAKKGPADVLVIDHIAPPTPN
ncbi:MAG TPA: TIGR03435 family protein [Acidobacteriaceae bacterium]|nr:TIGR03435 family protein [Acidobacteriaceae bacterium]